MRQGKGTRGLNSHPRPAPGQALGDHAATRREVAVGEPACTHLSTSKCLRINASTRDSVQYEWILG